jgi:hypothetical protein
MACVKGKLFSLEVVYLLSYKRKNQLAYHLSILNKKNGWYTFCYYSDPPVNNAAHVDDDDDDDDDVNHDKIPDTPENPDVPRPNPHDSTGQKRHDAYYPNYVYDFLTLLTSYNSLTIFKT